ncbi:MAG: hypothetical protein ACOC2W_02290 [bacterium]
MKNIKTYESFLDRFRPDTSHPLPEPEEREIEGKSVRNKSLDDLTYSTIRDKESEIDLYIEMNNLEFIDINIDRVIISFGGIPNPGDTIDQDGNVLDDEELEEIEDQLLYYDVNGNHLEVYNGEIEFTFSLKEAIDVTDLRDE